MKTIKERAWEKYPEVIKYHNLAKIDINEGKRKMYIEIATEQKAADIEKALTAHCSVCEFCNECKERGTLMQCGSCLFIKSKMEE